MIKPLSETNVDDIRLVKETYYDADSYKAVAVDRLKELFAELKEMTHEYKDGTVDYKHVVRLFGPLVPK